jgi:hypothetical protein
MNTPALGILMILCSLGLVVLGTIVIVHARLKQRSLPLRPMIAIGGGWALLYLLSLGVSSLMSRERLLGLNQDKQFCGFYIDCHLQVAVKGVDTMRTLGPATTPLHASGVFYVVTLRLSSTARAARLRLLDPRFVVRDAAGHEFARAHAAESLVAAAGAPAAPLMRELGPDEEVTTTVVFDVPAGTLTPRLIVTEGIWADRLIEFFLIGDEDSALHKRTAFALTSS